MIVGKDTVMVRKRYDRPVRLSLQIQARGVQYLGT